MAKKYVQAIATLVPMIIVLSIHYIDRIIHPGLRALMIITTFSLLLCITAIILSALSIRKRDMVVLNIISIILLLIIIFKAWDIIETICFFMAFRP